MGPRRTNYSLCLVVAALIVAPRTGSSQVVATAPVPISGDSLPLIASFDSSLVALMRKFAMPGGSIAIAVGGRLVYARGFGWSDVEARVPVEPTSLFRIASVSKPITSAAIMKLVESGKLKLSDHAFDYLRDITPMRGATRDPRVDSITIEMLLQHTAGWARDGTLDLSYAVDSLAWPHGVQRPPRPAGVIQYMLAQPLDRSPGTTYSYSNFGYSVLGRVIERVAGVPYEQYVREAILRPAGVRNMQLGRSQLADRATGEVKYYAVGGAPLDSLTVTSVFPGAGRVPRAYGFHLEVMDAAAGWIGSAIDVARFMVAVDGRPSPPDVIDSTSVRAMTTLPRTMPIPVSALELVRRSVGTIRVDTIARSTTNMSVTLRAGSFMSFISFRPRYASGWYVDASGPYVNWWHDGRLPGTSALVARSAQGAVWVALFNATPKDAAFYRELETLMWKLDDVAPWPPADLFARYK